MLEQLEKAQMVGQLAASLSHEIRNPLAIVRGHLQFLGTTEEQAAKKAQYELMIEQLDRVNTLLHDFLGVAKANLKQPQLVSLSSIISRLQPMLVSEAYQAGINLKIVLEEVPKLLLHSDDIQQMLLNLYRNALEATHQGDTVTIRVSQTGNRESYLEISDTGCGMTPAVLAKLGTPFMTTKPDGTGLGLLRCFNIAESYQAHLSFTSEPGQGTRVIVRFPGAGVQE